LLTTPEQLSLILASHEAETIFQMLDTVIFDELHGRYDAQLAHWLAIETLR